MPTLTEVLPINMRAVQVSTTLGDLADLIDNCRGDTTREEVGHELSMLYSKIEEQNAEIKRLRDAVTVDEGMIDPAVAAATQFGYEVNGTQTLADFIYALGNSRNDAIESARDHALERET